MGTIKSGIIVLVVDHIWQVGICTTVTLKCYNFIHEPAGRGGGGGGGGGGNPLDYKKADFVS